MPWRKYLNKIEEEKKAKGGLKSKNKAIEEQQSLNGAPTWRCLLYAPRRHHCFVVHHWERLEVDLSSTAG